MNYEEQLAQIRALGISDNNICRVKHGILQDITDREKEYSLKSGNLAEGEFWILRYYDEQGIWQEVVGDEPRELSTPAEFLNQMLSELRMYKDIDKLDMLPKALEMLSKAVELNLQGEDHPRHRIKADAIMNGSKLPELPSLEALSLAFQAGELMERFGVNYRGVMDNARKGVSFSKGGGGRKKKSWEDLEEWEQALALAWKSKPKNDVLSFLNALEKAKALQWDEESGDYKFAGGDWISDDSAKRRIRRFLKRLEADEISVPS